MRTLAIDTSGRACSIALFDDGNLIAHRHDVIGRGHAEWLVPWISELLGEGSADQILTGVGPGSFTGVRVAIAAARGLGLAWHVPVHGVNSLALVAAAYGLGKNCLVAVEGGHGELFLQPFQSTGQVGALGSFTPEAGAALYNQETVIGSGAERLVAVRGYGTAIVQEADAAHILKVDVAQRSLPPSPIYGRAPDAKPRPATEHTCTS